MYPCSYRPHCDTRAIHEATQCPREDTEKDLATRGVASRQDIVLVMWGKYTIIVPFVNKIIIIQVA
jgi:hypothetical protein